LGDMFLTFMSSTIYHGRWTQ